MMLSAIISDTCFLNLPNDDLILLAGSRYLAKIAGVDDHEKYGVEMLKAGPTLTQSLT